MDVNEDDEEEEAKEGGRNKRPFKEKSGKMCVVCPWLHGIKKRPRLVLRRHSRQKNIATAVVLSSQGCHVKRRLGTHHQPFSFLGKHGKAIEEESGLIL